MLTAVAVRLLSLVPALLGLALVTFAVMHATPGSPLDPVAQDRNPLTPEAQAQLARAYALDRPWHEQFGLFVAKAVQGDFGRSYMYRSRTVGEIVRDTVPVSLHLGAMALAVAVVGGVSVGLLAATHQNRLWDHLATGVATLGASIPNFILAVFLIVTCALLVPLFATGGWMGPRDWVLPTLTLALGPLGIIARYTRAGVLDALRSDFVRTARAMGVPETRVLGTYVLKNSMIPVVTLLGPMFAAVGTGSFFVESIFRVPGLGRFFVLSIAGRDYPVIMAVVLIYGAAMVLANIAVDLVYCVLDPRTRP